MAATEGAIFWKVGDPRPAELNSDPFASVVIPKPCAWICVENDTVALLEGFNAVSHAPPTLMFAAQSLPPTLLNRLKETNLCSLSTTTVREQHCVARAACPSGSCPSPFSFDELNLEPCTENPNRPPAVKGSPIQMHCCLMDVVSLNDEENQQQMVLLEVETIVIRKEVLSPPSEQMKTRHVLAKIDAELIKPVASIGGGRFVTYDSLHSMRRPFHNEDWESDPFAPCPLSPGPGEFDDIEYTFRDEQSSLGYNPVKAIVLPRPIGWISTFRDKDCQVAHLAPYSFFIDVGRPVVAFSSYRKSADDEGKKDAQTDAETMGCFATNVVSADLAVQMNYTSAPLARDDSEFTLSGLDMAMAQTVNAPIVQDSPIVIECRYVKTVDVSSFSIVVGQVVAMRINPRIVTNGQVDVTKLRPVSRLGYADEYAIVDQLVVEPKSSHSNDNEECSLSVEVPLRPCGVVPSG